MSSERKRTKPKKPGGSDLQGAVGSYQNRRGDFLSRVSKSGKILKGLLNEAKVEHDSAKNLIDQILKMDANEELFDAKVTVLSEYVSHHIEEEEKEMFPLMKKAGVDLEHLGRRLEERKKQLS